MILDWQGAAAPPRKSNWKVSFGETEETAEALNGNGSVLCRLSCPEFELSWAELWAKKDLSIAFLVSAKV